MSPAVSDPRALTASDAFAAPGAPEPGALLLLVGAWCLVFLASYTAFSLLDPHPAAERLRVWQRRLLAAALLALGTLLGLGLVRELSLPDLADRPWPVGLGAAFSWLLGGAVIALAWFDRRNQRLPVYFGSGLLLALSVAAASQTLIAARSPTPMFLAMQLLAWLVALVAIGAATSLASYLRRRRTGGPIFLTVSASLLFTGGVFSQFSLQLAALAQSQPALRWPGDPALLVLAAGGLLGLAIAAVFSTARRRRAESRPSGETVRRGARQDTASGLPTVETLGESFVRVQRLAVAEHGGAALAVVHLHGLDRVVATVGPDERDRLFSQAAWRLRSVRRDEELLGVLGDQRFLLVMRCRDGEDACRRGEELLAQFEQPLSEEDVRYRIRPSVGLSLWPGHGDDFARLLANALVALERCPPHALQLFHATQREESERRLRLESSLSSAIAQGELGVVFQPVVDALSNEVRLVELLARWNTPELGEVPPKQFILIAESSGVIGEFDRWLVREAIATTKWLDAAGFVDVRVAMNCSPVNLSDPAFMDYIETTLRGSGIDIGRIEVEVTEAALAEGDRAVVESLLRLRRLGLGLTIDDFGIGHSSLARLRDLPVDTLKIDQSFVRDMDHPKGEFLVSGILGLAHGLGKAVVAEGVETDSQRAALADLGCEFLQGYLISRPLSWRALLDFLGDRSEHAGAAAPEPAA